MARIRGRKPKTTSGSYLRLFDNEGLGELISKIQGTVIANGAELESIINKLVKEDGRVVNNFDEFVQKDIVPDEVYLIPKNVLKKSKVIDFSEQEPDFVVLKAQSRKRHCHIIELKDGDNFDTKKALSEKVSLQKFENYISTKIQYTTSIHVCCFNQSDKKKTVSGFKNRINSNEAMTGEEFCTLLQINYMNIVNLRKADAIDNLEYFVEAILKLTIVRDKIIETLKKEN
jgi:hypothetical protein